jgi:hypothetical protein
LLDFSALEEGSLLGDFHCGSGRAAGAMLTRLLRAQSPTCCAQKRMKRCQSRKTWDDQKPLNRNPLVEVHVVASAIVEPRGTLEMLPPWRTT